MATSAERKQGNLQLVRIERTPEELLDLEIAEAFAAIRGADGKVPARAFYAIAENERFPGRAFARRIREARAAKVTRAAILHAITRPLTKYVNRKYGMNTGEFDLAS